MSVWPNVYASPSWCPINTMQVELEKVKDSTCIKCNSLELKIGELNQVIKISEKCKLGLESFLSKQRYTNDTSGHVYSKFDKPSSIKTIFVMTNNAYTNV